MPIRKRIEATRRFSPEDEAQMLEIGKRFNSTVDFNDTFYRFRQLWLAENNHPLDPRPLDAPFILQPSERCYLASPSIWKRVETVKHRVMSRGHVHSIRIMKGWSYRLSTMKPVHHEEQVLAAISEGSFCVTNKRLVF